MSDEKRITARELSERLLGLRRLGSLTLFSDIDGTISPIAAQPDQAIVLPDAVTALAGLADAGVGVVLVTGRAASDAKEMVGIPHLGYAGNHGFELIIGDRHVVGAEVEAATSAVADAVVEVEKHVVEAGIDGILFEDKRYTGSVHYRLAADPQAAKDRLLPILRRVVEERGLRLTEGRLVFEIRPALPMNKGVFVSSYLTTTPSAAAVFLGDDLTDVDGFGAIQAARGAGLLTAGLAVGVEAAESPAQVLDEADVIVAGTSEAAAGLLGFLKMIEEERDA